MVDNSNKIQSFEDLRVWQSAQDFAVAIYAITKTFPADEMYALTSQVRRAATSISANIAEGFGRRTTKDKSHFYTMAYGSILEVKNFLYLAQKLSYIDMPTLESTLDLGTSVQKQLNALVRTIHA
jgi:four helix bundle protein